MIRVLESLTLRKFVTILSEIEMDLHFLKTRKHKAVHTVDRTKKRVDSEPSQRRDRQA